MEKSVLVRSVLVSIVLLALALPASAQNIVSTGDLAENITLITGDTVAVHNISGKVTYSILPDKNETRNYQIIESSQGTYLIPDDIDLKKVDQELFNINYLINEGYSDLSFIPVMLTTGSIPDTAINSIVGRDINIVSFHKNIGAASARLDKENTASSFTSLMANEYINKIWLDKKRHISLSESVPITGAPALWVEGYNGSGVKIAILDTGI